MKPTDRMKLGRVKPGGVVEVPAGAAGPLLAPCVTTGAPTDGIYPVDVHANGKNEAATDTGEMELLSVHIGEALPTGTWVMGMGANVKITGGS